MNAILINLVASAAPLSLLEYDMNVMAPGFNSVIYYLPCGRGSCLIPRLPLGFYGYCCIEQGEGRSSPDALSPSALSSSGLVR